MTTMTTEILVHPITATVNKMPNTTYTTSASQPPGTPTTGLAPIHSLQTDIAPTTINGREARNLAEKQRRDKLNASISELAKMVPHVADSPRRLDKTAVLRFATHGLRLQYVFGKSASRKKSLHKPESHTMTDTLLHLLDSFFITLTCHGQIVLVSSSVEQLLGHCQSDLYGQNILQITHPEDQEMLRQELIPNDIESLFFKYHNSSKPSSPKQQNAPSANFSQDQLHSRCSTFHPYETNKSDQKQMENTENYLTEIDEKLRADKRCFMVRLARASSRSESKKVYEILKIDGCFRRSDFSALATGSCGYPIVSQLIRRSRNNPSTSYAPSNNDTGTEGMFIPHLMQHDAIAQAALHGVSGNDIVLVAMARIIRPPKVMNYSLEGNRLEYKTRHLIDGRIIDCDNRIGLVAGYLKEEVCNLSPFSFMHQDDVRWVIVALRQMYDSNNDYGESCYRLLSRNGNFIYLSTKGYLEIDKGTNKVHSFVCINTLLDEEEGMRRVQEMKKKFSIIINTKIPTNALQDVPASQNPQQLERIVLYLIENLQKRQTPSACTLDEIHLEDDLKRQDSTPPLALVPPEPSSVKNSISKSVSVVKATAAKSFVTTHNNMNNNITNRNNDSSDTLTKSKKQRSNSLAETTNNLALSDESIQHRPTVLHINGKSAESEVSRSLNILNSPHNDDKNAQHVSVLKRLKNDTATTDSLDEDNITSLPAKRMLSNSSSASILKIPPTTCLLSPQTNEDSDAANIHDFISSSLRHVGESLDCIDVKTSNLRQNCSSLPTCLDNKLDAIISEQKEQNEFLVNIKNEYEVYKEQYPTSIKCTQNSHKNQNQHQHKKTSSSEML